MAEPEIAKRCHACGASVRQRAAFCPQCGKAIDGPASEAPTVHSAPETLADTATDPAEDRESEHTRVEKLRKISSVVIDQAGYDPSLRFLLVAAVLFLLFLVLLIISKVLG